MKFKTLLIAVTLVTLMTCVLGGVSQAQNRPSSGLTGTYQLDRTHSDDPSNVADRVSRNLSGDRQRLRDAIMRRLESPDALALDVHGRMVTMASTQSGQVTFDADGRAQMEESRNGRMQRTTATLSGNRLTVSTTGDRAIDYQVTFELIGNGQSMRVTRSITDESLRQPVVARSIYDKTADSAYWDFRDRNDGSGSRRAAFTVVPDGTELVATLNDDLSTRQVRDGDRFTLTVHSPGAYDSAVIEGHVTGVHPSGQVAGRAGMGFAFERIRLRDGRSSDFDAFLESVRTTNGETVNIDNEGQVRDKSQTDRTVARTGVGAAIGAVIGAIAGGGKGAAIGAAVGAGAGAGTVFAQGRDDLDLIGGTEFQLRSTTPDRD